MPHGAWQLFAAREISEIFIGFPCQQKSLLFSNVSPGGRI